MTDTQRWTANQKFLEMTHTGKILDSLTTDQNFKYMKSFWNMASERFAKGAGQGVDVFHSSSRGVRLESVWATKEYPQLLKKGVNINYHLAP